MLAHPMLLQPHKSRILETMGQLANESLLSPWAEEEQSNT